MDEQNFARPVAVGIQAAGAEIASGLANRFRRDLITAGIGYGWCAFRLKLLVDPGMLEHEPAVLVDLHAQTEIVSALCPIILDGPQMLLTSVADISLADPTTLQNIDQLAGCTVLFDDFIEAEGVDAFVSRAYGYVLGRPVDEASLLSYTAALRSAALTPYEMLKTLAESEEFQLKSTLMLAPTEPGFAFRRA